MSEDIYVGFKQRPEGLHEVLVSEGFEKVSGRKNFRYEHNLCEAYYKSEVRPGQRSPNWRDMRQTVVAQLEITCFGSELEHVLAIARDIADRYNAILYEPGAFSIDEPEANDDFKETEKNHFA